MTPDQINAKITELCGWTKCTGCEDPECNRWMRPGETFWRRAIPPLNYLGSLDACAEMEATMDDEQHNDFTSYLVKLFGSKNRSVVSATAPQRCAAFLKLHGIDV